MTIRSTALLWMAPKFVLIFMRAHELDVVLLTGMRMEPPRIDMERFDVAVKSMTNIGISKETTEHVLKNLLVLYEYNWEHIEADNYQTLADAILEEPDPTSDLPTYQERKKKRAEKKNLDSDTCNKKQKVKERGKSNFYSNGNRELSEVPRQQGAEALDGKAIRTQSQKSSSRTFLKEPKMETDLGDDTKIGSALPLKSQGNHNYETPPAVMSPHVLEPGRPKGRENVHVTSGVQHLTSHKSKGVRVSHEGHMADAHNNKAIVCRKDYSTNFEVALSNSGKGKLSFSFNSSLANRSNFRMPDIESICKAMETRCLMTYKILEPNFSFMKLLDDTCQCIIDLGSGSSEARESIVQVLPAMDLLSKPSVPQSLRSNQASSSCMPLNNIISRFGGSSVAGFRQNNSSNMQVIQYRQHSTLRRQFHDVNDIAKGEECVRIPIVAGADNGVPPPFHYIAQNITFQDAYINLSLARIGDENCCSQCFGDCLAAPLPCACASETGGEFAYTRDGLLKKEFLDACVSILQEPHKHPHFYCKICPSEKIKVEQNSYSPKTKVNPDPCKGHLIRKFIKECWKKCGCTRNCGNRVVQRGITRSLEASQGTQQNKTVTCNKYTAEYDVFLTPGEKGWGLRTAEKLPPGAFICEYAGEILTNIELHERIVQKTGNGKHTYPLNLDADWGTEGVLKDDEALSLDATFYGNVARFINHRCFDGNLIGIPVEIETPDHHYYHLAFFTKKQVEPLEELTWVGGASVTSI
ncbi:hypothetical protein EJB05_20741, partial [Eragrostis curvula]